MSIDPKAPDAGESTLSGTAPGAWETVTPKTEEPLAPAGVVLPPPASQQANPIPGQGQYVPPAGGAPSTGSGYQPVFGGAANASTPGAGYGQGYGTPGQTYPPNYPQGAPPNYGASAQPNYPQGAPLPPPAGYAGQAPPPYGQQGYYPPPGQQGYYQQQGQYNSPNVADMLAAGVLFGRGRRWQRRPGRLIFWPIMIGVFVLVGTLHGCMHLFSW